MTLKLAYKNIVSFRRFLPSYLSPGILWVFLISAGFVSGIISPKIWRDWPFQSNRTEIIISTTGFSPRTALISKGDTVVFTNKDDDPHWPASNPHPIHNSYLGFDPKRYLGPGESWSFVLHKEGTWFYHDHLNPTEGGTVIVKGDGLSRKSLTAGEQAMLAEKIEKEENENIKLELMREFSYAVGPDKAIEFLNGSRMLRYGQTHLISHVIGEVAYDLYREDGFSYCVTDMLNGCVHGLILSAIADIGIEGVEKMVERCELSSPFKYHMCLHASGHGFMALENYNLPKALSHCQNLISLSDHNITHCFNGVFMENVHGAHDGQTPDTHPWLSRTNLHYPCDSMEERYAGDCYLNQAGWWYQIFGGDLKKTAEECGRAPERFRIHCANNFGRVLSTAVKNDIEKIRIYCRYLNGVKMREMCVDAIAQSVFALGEEKLPFELCRLQNAGVAKKNCYASLYSAFKTNKLTPEKTQELCHKIEPEYKHICK